MKIEYWIRGQTSNWVRGAYKTLTEATEAAKKLSKDKNELVNIEKHETSVLIIIVDVIE